MKNYKKHILSIFIMLLIVIIIGVFIFELNNFSKKNNLSKNTIYAVFICSDNKTIDATFYTVEDTVSLILSDGRKLSVPRAISGSGARYANSNESFVFWNKGNGAFITENDTMTYQECLTNSSRG